MEILRRETDYALRAIYALHRAGDKVSSSELAQECDVTIDYIRKILPKLAADGMVEAMRGAQGGFRLAVPIDQINLNRVVSVMQGPLSVNVCTSQEGSCRYGSQCPMQYSVCSIQDKLDEILNETTLEDMFTK